MPTKINNILKVLCYWLFPIIFLVSFVEVAETNRITDTENAQLQSIVDDLKKSITNRDFRMMKPYLHGKKPLWFAPCGGHDSGLDKLSFESMSQMLFKNSMNTQIYVNPHVEIDSELLTKDELQRALIETEGWKDDFPVLQFSFVLLKTKNRWLWDGVCYSPTPEFRFMEKDNFRRNEKYFDWKFRTFLRKKSCSEAERYLEDLQKKYKIPDNRYIGWLFGIAQCFETIDTEQSLKLYRHLCDIGDTHTITLVRFRQKWLTGDHAWVFQKLSAALEGIKKGLRDKDVNILERYASKSNFYYGLTGNMRATLFNDEMKRSLTDVFQHSKVIFVGSVTINSNHHVLKVKFPKEKYPFWNFQFQKIEGGWQWTGIMISNK